MGGYVFLAVIITFFTFFVLYSVYKIEHES